MPHIILLEFRHFVPSCAEQTSPNEHFQLAKPPFEAILCGNLNLQYILWVWGHSLRESEPAVHTLWGHSLRELFEAIPGGNQNLQYTLFEAILWGNLNLQYTLFEAILWGNSLKPFPEGTLRPFSEGTKTCSTHSLRPFSEGIWTCSTHSLRPFSKGTLRQFSEGTRTCRTHSLRPFLEGTLWGNSPKKSKPAVHTLQFSEEIWPCSRERKGYAVLIVFHIHYIFWSKMLVESQVCNSLNISAVPTKACWMPRTLPIFTDLKEL